LGTHRLQLHRHQRGLTVDEVLYFVNTHLENDFLGLSDVETIRSTCKARNSYAYKQPSQLRRRAPSSNADQEPTPAAS